MTRQLVRDTAISENNPFGNQIAGASAEDAARFAREQAETLRKFYNQNESGETQVGWQRLTFQTAKPITTLGAIGRFKHPVYGMIRARYVQLGEIEGAAVGQLMGFQNDSQFAWRVTNGFARSANGCIAGFSACYDEPVAGQYGWLIFDGVNINAIDVGPIGYLPSFGDTFRVNPGSFDLLASGSGTPVGTVVSSESQVVRSLAPGSFLIKV